MRSARISVEEAMKDLARDPLRNIVLLKQLLAYPEHVEVHRASDGGGAATLVALQTSASPYDREAYPKASVAAFIASDRPALTASLIPHVPRGIGVVFKLDREADVAGIAAHFPVSRRTAFVSFTSAGEGEHDPSVDVTTAPDDAAFALFATQGHDRAWLQLLLSGGKAFACVLSAGGATRSACIASENYGPVWEVGGVVTAPSHRRRGLGARVVGTALAELARRKLAPRYQVEEHNEASIQLARSVGLAPFLTITHYAHDC
jgi:GNAT superfamily N-acetyltransferase